MFHPAFEINGKSFAMQAELLQFAKNWLSEEGEKHWIAVFIIEWFNADSFIKVQTSGSTGTPKLIQLQKENVENSARATIAYFNLVPETRALLCLSTRYIAGKMMLVRALIGGWKLVVTNPDKNPLENVEGDFDFTAMVPFQVYHAMADLDRVKKIIIGGGVVSPTMEAALQKSKTQAYATYGMTETISHIAVRQINGEGKSAHYTALPDVVFEQTDQGCLMIKAPKIADEIQITNDVVRLISPTQFYFLGRIDNVVNSGGVKIHPETVERHLSEYISTPFFVASEPDEALGQRLILVVETDKSVDELTLSKGFETLSPYERPKKIYTISEFSYTDTEKIKRKEVLRKLNQTKA